MGELVTRRIDGQVFDELMAASLRSPGLGPLEDQQALDALNEPRGRWSSACRAPAGRPPACSR